MADELLSAQMDSYIQDFTQVSPKLSILGITNSIGNSINKGLLGLESPSVSIQDFKEEHFEQIKHLLLEVQRSGVFKFEDTKLAMDVIKEKIANLWDYEIKIAQSNGHVVGFIAYSRAPLSDSFYDLYWVAVLPSAQGQGIGKKLLSNMEESIKAKKGKSIILDTSSEECYASARHLYEKQGYKVISTVKDFYKKGGDKLTYRKDLN